MNNHQRKWMLDLIGKVREAEADLNEIAEEEQEKVDNTPENLQSGERYEKMQETADELQSQVDELQGIAEILETYI